MENVNALRSQRPKRAPVVLSKSEVQRVFAQLPPDSLLLASVIYGARLRLSELQRLRVKDVDFDGGLLMIRARKGDKDRYAVLPESLREPLRLHLEQNRIVWDV